MADEAKKDEKEKKADQPAVDENPENDAKKRKKKLMILGILGALLIIGGGVGSFLFLSGGKNPKAEGDQEISAKGAAEKAEEHGGGEAKPEESHGEAKKEEGHEAAGKKAEEHGGAEKKPEEHGGGEEKKKVEEIKEDKKEAKSESNIDFGETMKMGNFNINLGNALENRYVRIEITLEYKGGGATKSELEKRMPQLRDAIIGILQRKTREFLLAPDGKEALRKEILTRINRYMHSIVSSNAI
ncbi:MAG: flagellar basal body-associated FliL family protein [Proteobacteria bacterium]|nr:flagellar basal body-associated FliL family protein [Pseudomonadota bacterium]